MKVTEPCRSCGKGIMWAVTENGKLIPIDPLPDHNGNIVPRVKGGKVVAHVLGKNEAPPPEWPHRYTSHFGTCPDAKRWKRRT